MTKLLLSVFAVSSLLQADFDPQHWQYRTPIQVPLAVAVCEIKLDSSVYRHSRAQLHDVRIVRGDVEIPYELEVSAGTRDEVDLPLTMLNKAVVPGHGLEVILDLRGHPQHNRLRIATAQKNFRETVRIETSDDARNWSLARSEAVIFDISRQDRTASDLTVEYPLSTRRYVRLTISGWTDPADLESAWLSQVMETNAVRDRIATLIPVVKQDPNTKTTSYTFDIGWQGQPYDEMELSVGPELFFRSVEVFSSRDAKSWTFAAATVISNRPDDTHLQFQFPEQWSRYLKLAIANGDSPPIKVKSVRIYALQRVIKFSSAQPGHYWLYSENSSANAPHYDLTQIAASPHTVPSASLGPPELNARYQPPQVPWTDRNPHLLTGLVIAAAAVMILVTVRLLLRLKTA